MKDGADLEGVRICSALRGGEPLLGCTGLLSGGDPVPRAVWRWLRPARGQCAESVALGLGRGDGCPGLEGHAGAGKDAEDELGLGLLDFAVDVDVVEDEVA